MRGADVANLAGPSLSWTAIGRGPGRPRAEVLALRTSALHDTRPDAVLALIADHGQGLDGGKHSIRGLGGAWSGRLVRAAP